MMMMGLLMKQHGECTDISGYVILLQGCIFNNAVDDLNVQFSVLNL
jgi:hypothetical protein